VRYTSRSLLRGRAVTDSIPFTRPLRRRRFALYTTTGERITDSRVRAIVSQTSNLGLTDSQYRALLQLLRPERLDSFLNSSLRRERAVIAPAIAAAGLAAGAIINVSRRTFT